MNFRFSVAGLPKAQPRPKAMRMGKGIRIYTPDTAKEWKDAIKLEFKAKLPLFLLPKDKSALEIQLTFVMPRPKAQCRANGEAKPDAPFWHVSRPDVDNLAKAVLDALQDAGAFQEDSQVARLTINKRYPVMPEEPTGVTITCQEI